MIFETWFLFALGSALVGGISFFANKYASTKSHDPDLSVLAGSVISLIFMTIATLLLSESNTPSLSILVLGLIVGGINSIAALFKMTTLAHLDVTVFLPLQKVLGPILILLVGLFIFGESFTRHEWIGMGIGLLVPLLLINKAEKERQSNLVLGIGFVFLIALLGVLSSSIGKISVDIAQDAWWVATTTNLGMVVGSLFLFIFNKRKVASYSLFVKEKISSDLMVWASIRGTTRIGSSLLFFFALLWGGKFVLVSFINSLYILIPIILSILIYKEHVNWQKVTAISISLLSLYFFL